jgi:hypothetical protein
MFSGGCTRSHIRREVARGNKSVVLVVVRTGGKRKQRDDPRPLDGRGDFPLMLGAIAGYPPGNDFTPFGDVIPEIFRIFIINFYLRISAELTYLPAKSSFSYESCHD